MKRLEWNRRPGSQPWAVGLFTLSILLPCWTLAGCGGTGVGSTPKALGEGCCTQDPGPDGQPCSLGTCDDGLECYLVPEGPNITRGVCTAPCINDSCQTADATCIFDRCMPVCEVPEDPADDTCHEDLTCRQIHSVGFCIP